MRRDGVVLPGAEPLGPGLRGDNRGHSMTAPVPASASLSLAAHPLDAAVVVAAVARIEGDGELDDTGELLQAFHGAETRTQQVRLRAWLLGERLGLLRELSRWRHLGAWVVLALALLLAISGLVAGRGVLAADRSINAIAAFVGLLGLHALTLLAWLLGWLWMQRSTEASGGGWSLGRLALGLTARLPLDRGRYAPDLWLAFNALLRRERLWPWLTGALSHTIWALSLALTLVVLAFGFAFQTYRLSWETTILSVGFFQRFVQWSGVLPAALGFPVPDAEAVRAVGHAGAADVAVQSAWAWWLMGCVAVYGVLPRLLLAALSLWRWRAGVARLQGVDMGDPVVQRIVQRLDALQPPPQVIDAEQRPPGGDAPRVAQSPSGASGAPLLVGFELPPEQAWPPLDENPAMVLASTRIAGSAAERQALLARIAADRPATLLLAVHAPSSPDRGTARFLREMCVFVPRAAVWPLGDVGLERWRVWLDSEGFSAVALMESAEQATHWIVDEGQS